MSQRLSELSVIAEINEDVALQLESERFLTLDASDRQFSPETLAWADEVADSYLITSKPKADEETLEKLAAEVDF